MTTTRMQQLAEQFFNGQDRLKGPPPADLLTASYRAEITGFPPMDAAAHADFARSFYAGFPDIHHTIDEVRATEDGAVVRFTLRGTHTGAFMGMPATNRRIEVSAIALMSVSGERVAHVRGMFDQLGLMRQLGVVPS